MKRDDFERALRLNDRKCQLDEMEIKLIEAWRAALQLKTENACDLLSAMIYNLMLDKFGEVVVGEFVGYFRDRFIEMRKEIEKEFEEL